ncbi:MAG: hypothetical protein JXA21_27405 [Anaerolineae bacterium]|nr:hypothetical protein [Anaerolineae bacterium]
MPICRTCRGEYDRRDCLCPVCGHALGRGENLCHQCGAETGGKRLCPRCKSDVTGWEREGFSLLRFLLQGGMLGLLPSIAALAMWVYWANRPNVLHHPLMTISSIGVSLMVIVLLHIQRLFWRERWWASQVYRTHNSPLTTAIGVTFAFGFICALIAFALHKTWTDPQPELKLIFAAFYSPIWVFFTAALTLLAIQNYMERLDQRVPQPIFVHTHRLLRVVVEGAQQSLGVFDSAPGKAAPNQPVQRKFEAVEIIRIPENGGLRLLLRELKLVEQPAEMFGVKQTTWEEKIWRIEADCWGRVQSLRPVEKIPVVENPNQPREVAAVAWDEGI